MLPRCPEGPGPSRVEESGRAGSKGGDRSYRLERLEHSMIFAPQHGTAHGVHPRIASVGTTNLSP